MDAPEETIVALPGPRSSIPMVSRFRSTWLNSSITSLKQRGYFENYLRYLAPEYHELAHNPIAGAWLPVAVAMAHYEACDRLELPTAELVSIGRAVTADVKGVLLGTLVRLARSAGVTPWTPLISIPRIYGRVWEGGAMAVYKLGPNAARLEFVSAPMVRFRYFQHAFCGSQEGLVLLFAREVSSTILPRQSSATNLSIRMQWNS